MLVVISDLHLTDGSSGETINGGAFRSFVENLESSVEDACWRRDGKFVPIDRCDLLLLGDVLDVIRSDRWLRSGAVRPWSGNDQIGATVAQITQGILAHNESAIRHLRDLKGKIRILDPSGQPVEIPFAIHYFVGNHDWFFHVRGADFDLARRAIVAGFGLANDWRKPFPHLLSEAEPGLLQGILAHRLYPQHGDLYDEMNYEAEHGRDYSSLGDCIVVELLNRFPIDVQQKLDLPEQHPDVLALREIDNVRPLLAIPGWIQGVLGRSSLADSAKQQVMGVWHAQVDAFLELPFVRNLDVWGLDKVDTLQVGLRLSGGFSLTVLTSISARLERLTRGETLVTHALKEEALERGAADFVAYGHTHQAETVSLALAPSATGVREQVYFNTGTWRRVHQRCIRNPSALEFGSFHVMSYVIFYRDGERAGRRYETWTGQLG
jgi:UDP-2,3-diacylglucosamine pyrophosphatase LpxH